MYLCVANDAGFSSTTLSCTCVTAQGVWLMYGTVRTLQNFTLFQFNAHGKLTLFEGKILADILKGRSIPLANICSDWSREKT